MLDLLPEIPFVALFIKFMIASTVLLGAVWLMEKCQLINTPDLAELAWKLAIAGSFIAVLPVADLMSSKLVIENDRTAALIEDLNETRPLIDLAPERQNDPEPLTLTIDSSDSKALLDAKRAIEAAQARLGVNDTLTGEPDQATSSQEYAYTTDDHVNFEGVTTPTQQTASGVQQDTAADTDNAQILTPEYDSEQTQKNPIWYSAADLRTKDLAALGWLALALLTVGALFNSYRGAVRNLGSRKRVDSESRPNQVLRALCEKADIRHVPYLSRSSAIKSPVCLPGKEICLPDWAFDDMPEAEFKSLLAHELGHMVRRDPIMLMALQMLSRIFFFQPLFIIARKRLTDIAELAADEWAAEQASDSRAVANALFTCATKIHETRQIQWGLAMAGNKSILKQRVERLIHAQSVPFKSAGLFAKTALGVGVIGLSLGLPSVEFAGAMTAERTFAEHDRELEAVSPVPPAPMVPPVPALSNSTHTSVAPFASSVTTTVATGFHPGRNFHLVGHGGNSGNLSWEDDNKRVSVKWEGDFSISDDDSFIEPQDDDGYLRIRTRESGEKREIKFEVEDGKASHKYKVNGDVKELDTEGRKWLKSSLKVLIQSGFNAEERVARILKKSKVKGVLKEVASFNQNYSKRIYLTELMDQADLSDRDVGKVISLVETFDSDLEKRMTLSALLEEENVSSKMLPKVLAVAKTMDSDFEKRLLISHFVDEIKLNDKTTGMLIDIAETIDSDFELRLLLSTALDENRLSDKNVERILALAIKRIDSDFEKRLLLTTLVDEYDHSDKAIAKALKATATIDSDFEKRLLLSTIVDEAKLNEANWLAAIEIAEKIDSDFEKSLTLSHFRGEAPKNNKKIAAALDKAMEGVEMVKAPDVQFFGSNGSGFAFEFDEDFNFSVEINEDFAEAISDLANGMVEIQMDRAEIIRELKGADRREAERALRDVERELGERQQELRNMMREQRNIVRQVERAEQQAVRQLEREIARVEREMAKAGKGLERELKEVHRQLEISKTELQRQIERRKERTVQEQREIETETGSENSDAGKI